jgi:hypothetical protein
MLLQLSAVAEQQYNSSTRLQSSSANSTHDHQQRFFRRRVGAGRCAQKGVQLAAAQAPCVPDTVKAACRGLD